MIQNEKLNKYHLDLLLIITKKIHQYYDCYRNNIVSNLSSLKDRFYFFDPEI